MRPPRLQRLMFSTLVAASACALVWFFYSENQTERQPDGVASMATPPPSSQASPVRRWPWQKGESKTQSAEYLDRWVQQEAQAMGRTDANPQDTLERLKTLAARLDAPGFSRLKSIALNGALGGDERFLAAYVMSLASSETALAALQDLASHPLPDQKLDARLYDQEVMIRAQALEGIARGAQGRTHLQEYLRRQDNVSLAQHAQRLLQSIKD